jgi:ABC-type phosphate/phosphonate transport system permease subunit
MLVMIIATVMVIDIATGHLRHRLIGMEHSK